MRELFHFDYKTRIRSNGLLRPFGATCIDVFFLRTARRTDLRSFVWTFFELEKRCERISQQNLYM